MRVFPPFTVCLMFVLATVLNAQSQDSKAMPDIRGIWEGQLKVGAIELRIVFKIEGEGDKLKATMDSPDQGATGIPISSVKIDDSKITLDLAKLKSRYEGELATDAKSMKGTWHQSGMQLPLDLKTVDKASEVRRPQTPKRPFPYLEETVAIQNKQAKNVRLAGTLSLPKGKGPFPAVVLISGSGPQDRDETILSHKPFAVIADHLTRKGVAVLRCDDRGVPLSTGDFAAATSTDFASDVAACVDFLKTRAELDPKRIGLIGHSEGGLIAPMLAAERDDISFIVLLAGPGVSGAEILLEQGQLIAKAMGETGLRRTWSRDVSQKLYAAINEATTEKDLLELIDASMSKLSEDVKKEITEADTKALKGAVKTLLTPWFRFFLTYDPHSTIAKVKCPVLALTGELDLQVPPKINLAEIEKSLKAGGNTEFTIKELPRLNHLFQTAETGAPTEYGKIEETFSPDALNVMSDWILLRK